MTGEKPVNGTWVFPKQFIWKGSRWLVLELAANPATNGILDVENIWNMLSLY